MKSSREEPKQSIYRGWVDGNLIMVPEQPVVEVRAHNIPWIIGRRNLFTSA